MTVFVTVAARVKPGSGARFEEAFAGVSATVRGTPGHLSDRLLRDESDPERYVLLGVWELWVRWTNPPRFLFCAPSEIRVTPPSRKRAATSALTVSGFASTVTSSAGGSARSKRRSSSGAVNVGVPPPRKTLSSRGASTSRSKESSASSAST